MNKRNKLITRVSVTAAIAAASIAIAIYSGKDRNTLTFDTVSVIRGSIIKSVTATGTIEPVTEVTIGTQVSGIIDRIYVDYNSIVTSGQLIAEMDKATLESELASAKAQYIGCEAEYEYQSKNFQRSSELHSKSMISDSEYELAQYNCQMAKSALLNSEAALDKAERNLSYATITSPISGVVIDKAVEEGQTVAAGFSTPTLFTIAADLTKMQVVADVDEADIGEVRQGQRVSFTVDAYPQDIFEGEVLQIRLGSNSSSTTSSTASESVVTYEVVISADNPDLKLKPRLTATITIYTMEKDDVLTVPSKALNFNPKMMPGSTVESISDCKAEHKVWTLQGDTLTAIPVTVGANDGITSEIAGIGEGTKVITGISVGPAKAPDNNIGKNPFMPSRQQGRK